MVLFLYPLALILSYAFIGGGIKLLDHFTDEVPLTQQRSLPLWLLTIILIVTINVWTIFDMYTAILALALAFGLLGARKVDNLYFTAIAVISLYIALFSILRTGVFLFLLPTLLALTIAVLLDEVLHSFAPQTSQPALHWVLIHRPLVKIVVIILPFFGYLTITHTIGFWCFDIAYDLVAYRFRAPTPIAKQASTG
jgi:hypothetical protein